MDKFTAVIEVGFLTFYVKARIDEDGANIMDIIFDEEPLTPKQVRHFIRIYGEADLDDEIMRQYREELEDQALDKAGEEWDAERRVA